MRDSNIELLGCVRKILAGEGDARSQEHVFHREDILDNVQREITEFLGKVMLKRLPSPVAERARRLLRLSDELESVSDETATILKVLNRLSGKGLKISETSSAVLLDVHDRMAEFAGNVSTLIVSPRVPFVLSDVQAASKDLHDKVRACRQLQLNRIGPDDPESALRVLGELDILNAYERIRAYYLNIAETLAGGKTN
jgi:Na+/phosphate symporter